MSRTARAVALATLALAIVAAPAAAVAPRRVLLVLTAERTASSSLETFSHYPQLESIALMTASIARYNEQQTLLDITQGTRVPRIDYSPQEPLPVSVAADGAVSDWGAIVARARSANASIEPGLLASSTPGGAAYAQAGGQVGVDALLAAGRNGRVAAVSLGSSGSLLDRVERLLAAHGLVVVDLADDGLAQRELGALLAARRRTELVLVLERPPTTAPTSEREPLLLALAAAGLADTPGALTTPTTRTDGLVSAADLAPTIIRWLGRSGPFEFTGQAITTGAPRSVAWLASFERRLRVIAGRRTEVLLAFLAAWAALIAAAPLARRDWHACLRLGSLAALWAPSTALVGALLEPSTAAEVAIVVAGALLLGAASDRLLSWPRAAAVPALVTLVLYTVDLARGSQLIELSLLGSNPIAGSRFFGVGNELAAVLLVVLLAGLAAAMPQRPLGRREVALFAFAGGLLTLIVAWGRLGANVGAIFTIGGGTVVATLLLAPGAISWRRLALGAGALIVALGIVALLDLASGGGAHFTREVLHAHSFSALLATLGRRLDEAWAALFTGAVLIAVLVCLAAAALAVRHRRQVLAPAGQANVWGACLGGGLAGSLLGSLANDSGPRLLLVGCFMLVCVLGYLWGAPARSQP
ncbi:MAG: hypothetical protein ABR946_05675 [Solirubrobacteraceae bacterium]